MKILDRKKWIILFSVLAVLAITARFTDSIVMQRLYTPDSFSAGIFATALPALPFVLCSFSSAVMMSCRNTRTTRSRNRALNIVYGVLSFFFALAAAYLPFRGAEKINPVILGAVAMIISGASIFLCYTNFGEIYQKDAMTVFAKTVFTAVLIAVVICGAAYMIPNRLCYDSVRLNIARTGTPEGPYNEKVPLIPLAGAASAMLLPTVSFKDVFPKLKFGGNKLFFAVCILMLAMIFAVQTSGKIYFSEAVYGTAAGCFSVLAASILIKKHKN